jgi:hypothetical protein
MMRRLLHAPPTLRLCVSKSSKSVGQDKSLLESNERAVQREERRA